jgi:hypothetical protein
MVLGHFPSYMLWCTILVQQKNVAIKLRTSKKIKLLKTSHRLCVPISSLHVLYIGTQL